MIILCQNLCLSQTDVCNKTAPHNGLIINSSVFATSNPGEEIFYTCSDGYSPKEVVKSVCKMDGTWNPDPNRQKCAKGIKILCVTIILVTAAIYVYSYN